MATHLLNALQVRNAKPKKKPYRLHDGGGLALLVSPTAKSWQYRFKLNGKEQTATLGKLDRVSLADARDKRDDARTLVDQGKRPLVEKKLQRARNTAAQATTFAFVAAAWVAYESRREKWSVTYREEVERSLANHLSALEDLPVSEIVATITAPLLAKVERNSPLMEEKVARRLHAIMDYAVTTGAIVANPLPRRRRAKHAHPHYAAIVKLPEIGAVLREARKGDPCRGIQRADALLTYTVQRVSEVVGAPWTEFDLTAGNWIIERPRMKRKDEDRGPHVVPLPPLLLASLREWRKIDGDDAKFVCPSHRNPTKPIASASIEKHYRLTLALKGKHSPHSWRSAFSTVCREEGKAGDVIEAQLDHVVGNNVASAYDRANRLELRRELMAWYESMLIAARDGATVLPIGRRSSEK